MLRPASWFGLAVWLGIVADWIPAVPSIVAPGWSLAALGQRPTTSATWLAFSGLLTVLLSLFFVPAALAPYRYPASAWLAVTARPLEAIFFLAIWRGLYTAFGLVDLALFVLQLPLLLLTMAQTPAPASAPASAPRGGASMLSQDDIFDYDGSTFAEVKAVAFSGPYDTLPTYRGLGPKTFLQFFNASARNLADKRDIRPRYDKLIHANGICFTGVWKVDRPSPYTGYFAQGSEGLLIARFSIAGPQVTRGKSRALGIAGKIFPTRDPNEKVKPGNFVTVTTLSGTKEPYVTAMRPTNSAQVGSNPAAKLINRVIFRLMDTRPGYRQLHPISTLGVPRGATVVTPDLMMLSVAEGTPRIAAQDFRDELRLRNYPGNRLVYTINVKMFDEPDWTRLGSMTFDEDAIGEGGDKRIHFWIPRDVPNLN